MLSAAKQLALSLSACIGLLSCGPYGAPVPLAAPEPQPFPISEAALGTIGVSLEDAMQSGVVECNVHHVPLDDATVAILYGMPYLGSTEYFVARESQFPYACSKVTSCGVPGRPVSASVRRCGQCTAAELEWEAAHR